MKFQYRVSTDRDFNYRTSLGGKNVDVTLDHLFNKLAVDVLKTRDGYVHGYENAAMLLAAGTLGNAWSEFEKYIFKNFFKAMITAKIIDAMYDIEDVIKDAVKGGIKGLLTGDFIGGIKDVVYDTIMMIAAENNQVVTTSEFVLMARLLMENVTSDPSVSDLRTEEIYNITKLVEKIIDEIDIKKLVYNTFAKYVAYGVMPTFGSIVDDLGSDVAYEFLMSGNIDNVLNIADMHQPTVCLAWMRALKENRRWLENSDSAGMYRIVYFDAYANIAVYDADGEKVAEISDDSIAEIEDSPVSAYFDYTNQRSVFVIPADADYSLSVSYGEGVENTYCTLREYDQMGTVSSVTYDFDTVYTDDITLSINSEAEDTDEMYLVESAGSGMEFHPVSSLSGSELVRHIVTKTVIGDGSITGESEAYTDEEIVLTAVPHAGAAFNGWYMAGELVSTEKIISITVEDSFEIVANFGVVATDLILTAPQGIMCIGESQSIIYSVEPAEAEGCKFIWSSSDENVVSVSRGGIVTAIGSGSAVITAKSMDGEVSASCEIIVRKNGEADNSVSLSLEGNIGINFYLDLDAYADAQRVEITCADTNSESGRTVTYVFDDLDEMENYKFTVETAAAQMTEPVSVVIYGAQDTVLYTKNLTVRDMLETYVEYYVDNPVIANLCRTMLTYGANAQRFFDYNVSDLADATYGADISAVTAQNLVSFDTVFSDADNTDNFAYAAQTFSCRSSTVMRYAFTVDKGMSAADFTAEFIAGGEDLALEITDRGSQIVVSVSGIPAAYLDNYFTFTIYAGERSLGTINSCGLCYAKLVLNSATTSDELKELVKSIYVYNAAANVYFGK